MSVCFAVVLYIFIFLHQTTTKKTRSPHAPRCISLYSYIKPQLILVTFPCSVGCISLYSYIKPQRWLTCYIESVSCISLYSYIKPQPTCLCTTEQRSCISLYSYIKPQLLSNTADIERVVYLYIPTSNHNRYAELKTSYELYIFIFLHQTTTSGELSTNSAGCISLYSYIKPQLII